MTENEYCKEFIKRLASLAAAMGEDVSKERQRAYWEFFKTKDPEATLAAIERAFGECRFFPKPADIVALMKASAPVRADAAWAGVLKLCECYWLEGHYAITDGATAWAVKQMGGIATLRNPTSDDLRYLGRRFGELYTEAAERGLDREAGRVNGPHSLAVGHQDDPLTPLESRHVPESIAPPAGAELSIEYKPAIQVTGMVKTATARLAEKMSLNPPKPEHPVTGYLVQAGEVAARIAAQEAACPELSGRP